VSVNWGGPVAADLKRPLFRTIGRTTGQLTTTPLPQANAHAMIRRRAAGAGIKTPVGNHTFRATGITAYLKNGGTLENAAAMANHASTRTTQLYDRRARRGEPRRGGADFDLSAAAAILTSP
jgi:integrase